MPPVNRQTFINRLCAGSGHLVQWLDKREAVVLFVDPAHKDKDKLGEDAPLWKMCDDKVIPWTSMKFGIAA